MDHNDRQAIEGLFHKLGQAARSQPHRDPEAEALIGDLIARNPGAAYYLAQTVIVQEQALNAAQDHIQQLQHQPQPQQGGLFGRLFGGGQQHAPRPMPPRPQPAAYGQQPGYGQAPQGSGPWSSGRPSGGGGFMAGAAQTAMGVAGGVLLGNAIGGMFAGDAAAAEAPAEEPMEDEAGYDDAGYDDGGDFE
ncbi:ABC transporter substrate-binding protein [Paracoccus acridae]|uniref:ABC transporter substrate-binding protein n=1 Tax=Paracoccus acridae TaxID=1795310 RepID=A0ABQ1VM52_9RHOB|nr:DUF2076 family protein [Paracoccus acridae]GGF79452.1 ABC transporter substrate-binding protein [Paracoccus acridae]